MKHKERWVLCTWVFLLALLLGTTSSFGKGKTPTPRDTDKDGVPDHLDKCPRTPGVRTGAKEKLGCPFVVVSCMPKPRNLRVFFVSGSAAIQPKSHPVLRNVADVMKQNPQIKVLVEGHTDDRLGQRRSLRLGRQRAVVVQQFLIKLGVSPERLKVRSYGSTKPLLAHKQARAKLVNNRVSFHLLKKKKRPSLREKKR